LEGRSSAQTPWLERHQVLHARFHSRTSAVRKDGPSTKLRSFSLPALLLLLPGGLLALALLTAAAAPALLATELGTAAALKLLNANVPVTADRLRVSWLGPMFVEGLQVAPRDKPETPAVSAQRVSSDNGLLGLLLQGQSAKVSIEGLSIDALLDDRGDFRILQLLSPSPNRPVKRRRPLPPGSSLKRSVKVGFTADAKWQGFQVAVTKSSITMPDPYREIAGGAVHVSGWLGAAHANGASWASQPSASTLAAEPFELKVTAPNAELATAGWRGTGGVLRLREPAAASVAYSPALAEYGLSLLNPLLGDAVSLQQGGRVHLTFAPDGLAYPTASTTVRMEPLQLTVARSPLLRQLLATLALADRSIGKIDALNIWTAPLEAEVSEAGPVRTRRTDLLLSGKSGQGGVHLVVWGTVDSQIDGPVDVTLGIPADTLKRLGLDVPADHVLPVSIGGTSDAYRVDWTSASSKLATLLARQRAGGDDGPADLTSAGGWAKELFKRALKEADKAAVITQPAPELREPLPWQQ
jgi:hypothetical protein